MSITNFEEITSPLNDYELELVPIMVASFKTKNINNPIKAADIISSMKANGYKMSGPRLRKICNYIRTNSLLPLIATSKGYYVSYDKQQILDQIQSLQERADAIKNCALGMRSFL